MVTRLTVTECTQEKHEDDSVHEEADQPTDEAEQEEHGDERRAATRVVRYPGDVK